MTRKGCCLLILKTSLICLRWNLQGEEPAETVEGIPFALISFFSVSALTEWWVQAPTAERVSSMSTSLYCLLTVCAWDYGKSWSKTQEEIKADRYWLTYLNLCKILEREQLPCVQELGIQMGGAFAVRMTSDSWAFQKGLVSCSEKWEERSLPKTANRKQPTPGNKISALQIIHNHQIDPWLILKCDQEMLWWLTHCKVLYSVFFWDNNYFRW